MNASLSRKFLAHVLLPLLCLAVLAGAFTLNAEAADDVTARLRPDITIVIDGSKQTFYNAGGQQVHPISFQDTTYLPLRAIGEVMGKNVDWNQSTKTVTLSGARTTAAATGTPDTNAKAGDITAELRDDFTVVVDGKIQTFADANGKTVYPLLYQGSTYLPIRAIGKLMGKTVSWDGKTSTVTLSGSEVTDADTFSGETAPSGVLSAEKARAAALSHAGLAAADVTFTETKLERDDGRQVYDIEFQAGDMKYDYEIDAVTGEVVSYEVKSGTPRSVISKEKAQEIALAKVPGADASHVTKLKLDRDDGKQFYEVEIDYQGAEYEMEIDAVSGEIIDFDMDSD